MWLSVLEKHFPVSSWKKYYSKIIFYVFSVFFGLKPSLLWDFGPNITARQISKFVKDLKSFYNNTEHILIVVIGSDILLTNTSQCLKTLTAERFFIEIYKENCNLTTSMENENIRSAITFLSNKFRNCDDCEIWLLQPDHVVCPPSLFGLLLNYPVVYYFSSDYKPFCTTLKVFSVTCFFSFDYISERFQIFSFSIPKDLLNCNIDRFISNWYKSLKLPEVHIFSSLSMESTFEDVDALIL